MSALFESEVVIQFDKGSDIATIYTSDKDKAKVLMKKGQKPISTTTFEGEITGWTFELPKHCIRIKVDNRSIRIGGAKKREVEM